MIYTFEKGYVLDTAQHRFAIIQNNSYDESSMGETSGAKSPVDIRLSLGRSSVRRPKGDHQGQRSNPTQTVALSRAEKAVQQRNPTAFEKQLLFLANPSAVRTYKAAGMSDDEIYKILSR